MRASLIFLVALGLAGCASQAVPQQRMTATEAYAGVNDLEEFYRRGTVFAARDSGGYFDDATPALQSCVIRGTMPLTPQGVHDAARRFLDNKTESMWQEYMKVSEALMPADFESKIQPVVDDCKVQYPS